MLFRIPFLSSQLRFFRWNQKTFPYLHVHKVTGNIALGILSHQGIRRIGDYCTAFQGEVNETTDGKRGFISDDPSAGPQVLRGSNLGLYTIREASQGKAMFLRKDRFLSGKPESVKANHHRSPRVGWQESSAQNNFRRIIAAMIPEGQFCNHKINYFPNQGCQISLDLVLAFLNSKIADWYFRLTSTSAAVSHYQLYALPFPTIVDEPWSLDWRPMFEAGDWSNLSSQLIGACNVAGELPREVALAVEHLSLHLRAIETKRILSGRAERSRLAT